MQYTESERLFEASKKCILGGVNSPVRAYQAVHRTPVFVERASGSHIYDVDGNAYIDYVCSWGPCILGHAYLRVIKAVQAACENGLTYGAPTGKELKLAELIRSCIPSMEVSRLVSSGTEATMSAIRVARGFTGRDKVVKFRGCYHGHSDGLLVKAGSGALTQSVPDSKGVPADYTKNTLVAEYNQPDSVQKLFETQGKEIAAIIVEPVAANMGVVGPAPGFLQGLRELCDQHGTLLIFDEVITGFRLAPGGAQEYFGVKADLVTYGKIIGGGMPVGAYGGSRALMEHVAPCGPVYQAGTLSGNPVAMAAGLAQLRYLHDHPQVYTHINDMGSSLAQDIGKLCDKSQVPVAINQVGSLLSPFFTPTEVSTFVDAKGSDVGMYARYFGEMLQRGIYLAPAQFEAMFLSAAMTEEELRQVGSFDENGAQICPTDWRPSSRPWRPCPINITTHWR